MSKIFVTPLVLGSLLALSQSASAVQIGDAATDELVDRLTRSPSQVALPPLPTEPVKALVDAVNLHSATLGFSVDHGPAIKASKIPKEFAGRVALLLQAVIDCRVLQPLTRDLTARQK